MLVGIYEARLKAKERNELPDKLFGLPDERKYPLTDEAHIIKAIQFFKHCEHSKKNELATNINKRLNELDMKVNISKDSAFYKYINKKYIATESPYAIYTITESLVEENPIIETRRLHPSIMQFAEDVLARIDTILVSPNIKDNILSLEHSIYDTLTVNEDDIKKNAISRFHMNPYEYFSNLIYVTIKRLASYCEYEGFYIMGLYNTINDLTLSLHTTLNVTGAEAMVSTCMDRICDLLTYQRIDKIYVILKLKMILSIYDHRNMNVIRYPGVSTSILERLDKLISKFAAGITSDVSPDDYSGMILSVNDSIDKIRNSVTVDSLRLVNECVSDANIAYLESMKDHLESSFGDDFIYTPTNYSLDEFINENRENYNFSLEDSSLTEGFSIDKKGNIKISLRPKKSYMDEYSENHKILKSNYENGNYEGMKSCLAFAFMMISIIERDSKYKDRNKDVVNARKFFINDFKTYLKLVQKKEPKFDFAKYYKGSDFDKYVFEITNDTILGIKQIVRSLLL